MSDFDADIAVNANDQTPEPTDDVTLDDGSNDSSDDGQDDSTQNDDNDQAANDQGDQDSGDDSGGQDGDDGGDEPLEFDAWKKQYDLPDDIKSEDDLAMAFAALKKSSAPKIEMTPEMQRVDAMLKAQGLGGVEAFLDGKSAPQPQGKTETVQSDPFFLPNPFVTHVEKMVKNGILKTEDAGSYQTIARLNDQVMNPIMEKMMSALQSMSGIMLSNRDTVNNLQFSQMSNKLKGTGVTKEQLNSFMREHNINDYESGIMAYAAINDPSLFGQFQANAEERGKNKALKKLKRSTSKRKNRSRTISDGGGFDYKKYANSDGSMNEESIGAILDPHAALKIIDQYEKWAKRRKTA